MSGQQPLVLRLLRGFARFWWDFLVGDTPELFVAALVIIGAVSLISQHWHANILAVILLPVLVIAALSISVKRARDEARRG